jgi:hypothetical protein
LDPTALLILPLIGGYIFAYRWNACRFHGAREEGHRLYFRAAFYGTTLLLGAYLLRLAALGYFLWYEGWETNVRIQIAGFLKKEAGTEASLFALLCFYAFVAGSVAWFPLNFLVGKSIWLKSAVADEGELEQLLHRAVARGRPILLTMDNRKVYVGLVRRTPEPRKSESRAIWLLPLISGYRDDKGKVRFTTYYDQIYATMTVEGPTDLTAEDFELVLPSDSVQSAHLFDPTTYTRFQKLPTPASLSSEDLERERKGWRR